MMFYHPYYANKCNYMISVFSSLPVSVATVHEYAMKGLDKMEEKLPILHQPADKVTVVKYTFLIVTGMIKW